MAFGFFKQSFEDAPKPKKHEKGIVAEDIPGMPYNDGRVERDDEADYYDKDAEENATEEHWEVIDKEWQADQDRQAFIEKGPATLDVAQRGGSQAYKNPDDRSKQRTTEWGHELHSQMVVDHGGPSSKTPVYKTKEIREGAAIRNAEEEALLTARPDSEINHLSAFEEFENEVTGRSNVVSIKQPENEIDEKSEAIEKIKAEGDFTEDDFDREDKKEYKEAA